MLLLKPNCECCNQDLAADAPDAMICSFECTFCAACAQHKLRGRCPSCGGELVRRAKNTSEALAQGAASLPLGRRLPVRPADKLAKYPASSERVYKPQGCAA